MKKIKAVFLLTVILSFGASSSFASSIHKSTRKSERYEQVKYLKISELVNLSAKQFSELSGKKMNMLEKVSFGIMKIKMKHDLKKNPNLTLKDYYSSGSKKRLGTGWWILIGVAALLLLVVILFITSYAPSY